MITFWGAGQSLGWGGGVCGGSLVFRDHLLRDLPNDKHYNRQYDKFHNNNVSELMSLLHSFETRMVI